MGRLLPALAKRSARGYFATLEPMMTPSPSLGTLEIEEFGCIRKMSMELTRLHALIGPNDSGKRHRVAVQ